MAGQSWLLSVAIGQQKARERRSKRWSSGHTDKETIETNDQKGRGPGSGAVARGPARVTSYVRHGARPGTTRRDRRRARPPGVPARALPPLTLVAAVAIGALAPRYEGPGVLAVVGVTLILLAWLRPAIALATLLPLGPVALVCAKCASTAMEASLLVALVVTLRALTRSRSLRPAHLWIVLLASALVISFRFPAFGSFRDPAAFSDLVGLLAGLALLTAAAVAAPRPGLIARAIALTGALTACYALAFGDEAGGRLEALGFNPNYLGGLLALPCVAAVGLTRLTGLHGTVRPPALTGLVRLVRLVRRPLWPAAAAICLVAMVETQSRGAFLSAVAGAAVVFVQGPRSRAVKLIAIAGAVPALYGGLGLIERFAAGGRPPAELAYDTAVRGDVAEFAATVAARHPLRGIGFGTFASYAAAAPEFGLPMATHDDYLRLAAEAGALTLGAFLVLLWLGARERRSGDLAVLRAVVVAYATGLFFANPLANLIASASFWLALGCLLAAAPERREHPNEQGRTQ
jgi:hypothetical protein